MIDLSIIIVSWNVAEMVEACLESIERTRDDLTLEIIVVDSASSDDTVSRTTARFPHVVLMPQSENIGFSRCNNLGLARAQGKYLLLLNPDTIVLPGALSKLVAYLDEHPTVGIAGPHTHNSDGSHQSTRRRFPTPMTAFFESTWLQAHAPQGLLAHYYAADIDDDATAPVDWVQGSALMARRTVYEQIGGLDERFVMYSEELDWCRRAKDAGWGVVYVGDAHIIHHGGKSSDQIAAQRHIHFERSKLLYFRKYHGGLFSQTLRAFLLTGYGLQLVIETFKAAIGHKRALRHARMRAYWQVLRSGLQV